MTFLKKLKVCIAILTAFWVFSGPKASLADTYSSLASGGSGGWLNVTRPLTEQDMRGRLVLLDFWTYGCINCMQIVPDLTYLEQTYGDNLLIIGVHSAKFKGEQGSDRILAAAKRFGLEHPVINDSDFGIWKNFRVEAWPTQILLGPDGQEINRYEGEGHRNELDKDISKRVKTLPPVKDLPSVATLVPQTQTNTVLSFPARVKQYGDTIYIADSGHNRIIAVDQTGKITREFSGFNNPRGFAVENDTLFVADTGNHNLVVVNMQTGVRESFGGKGIRGRDWASPWDVVVDASQRRKFVIIAMAGTHRLWRYDVMNRNLSAFAGNGREGIDDGDRNDAELAQPSGLSYDANGDLYFVDAESSALRVVENSRVKTLIGTGLFDFGFKDGGHLSAQMQHPQGLIVKGDKVFIADTYNNAIRIYDMHQNKLSTITTTGEHLNEPGSIWVNDNDIALITDTNNNRILKLDLRSGVLSEFPVTQ